MTTARRKGGKADVHNEHDNKPQPNGHDVQKKCKGCGKTVTKTIANLVSHTNNCPKCTNKYNRKGMLMKAGQNNNSCNWSSMTGPSPSVTPHDIAQQQFEQIIDDEEDTFKAPSNSTRKKRKINTNDAMNENETNTVYGTKSIRTYCSGAVPMTLEEKESVSKAWAKAWVVCQLLIEQLSRPLIIDAMRKTSRGVYTPPSITNLKNRFISNLAEEDEKLMEEEIDGQKAWASADGSESSPPMPPPEEEDMASMMARAAAEFERNQKKEKEE